MPYRAKDPSPNRDCIVCGEPFDRAERGYNAITCGDDCAHARDLKRSAAYHRVYDPPMRAKNRDRINARTRELYAKRHAKNAR